MIALLDEPVFRESLPGRGGREPGRRQNGSLWTAFPQLLFAGRRSPCVPLLAGHQYIDAENHSINILNRF
jgi:hypothetical protein